MRSSFAAFLFGFVLPFGRTSGQRIVFNGPDAEIEFFDAANVRRLRLGIPGEAEFFDAAGVERIHIGGAGFPSEIGFFTGDVDEATGAFIGAEVLGAGGTRNLSLTMFSPAFTAEQPLVMQMLSESEDGTELPRLNVVPASAGRAEVSIEGRRVGRPVVPPFSSTANTAAHADLVVTDMVLNNLDVIAGHTYRFWIKSQWAISAVASTWILTLNVNTVVTTRMFTVQNPAAAALTGYVTTFADWVAPTTQATDDFAVGLDETTATAATFTLQGAAGVPRTFSVEDLGIL